VEEWLTLYAEHMHTHARQIDRTLAAWKGSGEEWGASSR
jgi:hypothetical protein